MTPTNTLRDILERMKFTCPDCKMPHNISSIQQDKLLSLIQKVGDRVIGEDWVEHTEGKLDEGLLNENELRVAQKVTLSDIIEGRVEV